MLLAGERDAAGSSARGRGVYSRPTVGRAFSSSYLAGEAAAAAFLPRDFRQRAVRVAAARQAAARRVDATLLAALTEQQAALPASSARDRNLEALARGHTAVVVSGQQVGLFLGPLYTFYKAATAIAAARAIETESGVRCVPLFWLQTEDHDFAEIASCTVAGRAGAPLRMALAEGAPELERTSVAHRRLGAEVTALLDAFADLAGETPAAREVLAVLRAHYRPGRSMAAAFAGALAAIFADEGLLFLDPRDARVAALAAPIYRRAITDAGAIDGLLARREQRLRDAGFDCQVTLRAGSPLVFFHARGADGPRCRLKDAGDGETWQLDSGGAPFSTAALLDALARDPLCFSTSALLRPIVQDALLPAAAYVGGPAELSYFAELDPLYGHFGVAPALVLPRARFRCVEARARRALEALGLSADDVERPLPELLARTARPAADGVPDPDGLRRRVEAEIAPVVGDIADGVVAAEPELARAAERTRISVARALRRLTDRYARRLAERDGVTRQRLERLRAALYPDGIPQERVFGWPTLAARVGASEFKRLVFARLAEVGPFATALQELRP
jgi:bacillithiol biosynthesis cysteine-adding enzyme BshC